MTEDQLRKGNRITASIRTLEYECRNLEEILKAARLLKLRTYDNLYRVDIPAHAVKDILQLRLAEVTEEIKQVKKKLAAI